MIVLGLMMACLGRNWVIESWGLKETVRLYTLNYYFLPHPTPQLGAITFSIKTLSIKTLRIMGLFATLIKNDI